MQHRYVTGVPGKQIWEIYPKLRLCSLLLSSGSCIRRCFASCSSTRKGKHANQMTQHALNPIHQGLLRACFLHSTPAAFPIIHFLKRGPIPIHSLRLRKTVSPSGLLHLLGRCCWGLHPRVHDLGVLRRCGCRACSDRRRQYNRFSSAKPSLCCKLRPPPLFVRLDAARQG